MMSAHGSLIRTAVVAGIVLSLGGTVRAQVVGQSTDPIPSPVASPQQDDANLNDVQFVGSQIGWAVGDHGVIWHTQDGGRNWRLVPAPVKCSLQSVCFLTNRVGWIVGGELEPFTRIGYGVVLYTDDGGANWQQLAVRKLPRLRKVRFFGMQDGMAAGESTPNHPTGVYYTQDGGQSWHDVEGARSDGWQSAEFIAPGVGIVVGTQGRLTSVGGGQLLPSRINGMGMRNLRGVQLQRDGTGWLVGDGGLALTTRNGGIAWQVSATPLPTELRDITDFHTVTMRGSHVWIAGKPGSVIWHSPDQGKTWIKQRTGQTQPIYALSFQTETNGFAVGAFGMILGTVDGGQNWLPIRGAQRRAAILTIHSRAEQVSFRLLAKQSAELGYRSVAALVPRRDVGPDGYLDKDLDQTLHAAVLSAGGSSGIVDWRLPIGVPGLEKNSAKLVAHWQTVTEGRLRDVVFGHLVCEIRTWRPSIIIIDEPPIDDAVSKLLYDATLQAVEHAADPTRFIEHNQLAGLSSWTVQKVYQHLSTGSTGHVHVDAFEVLPRMGQTVEMAAADAYSLIGPTNRRPVQRESYRTIIDKTSNDDDLAPGGGFFTRISLSAGSEARRELAIFDDSQLAAQRRLAQRQLHFRAYSQRMLEQPERAAALIAELNGVIADMPDANAALQLLQLAHVYRRQSRWDLAEATLVELVEKFPDQPATVPGMQWLFQLWSSEEMAWQRSRVVGVAGQHVTVDAQATQSRIQRAVYEATANPQLRGVPNLALSQDPLDLDVVEKSGHVMTDRNENWRNGSVKNWQHQAVNMAKLIRQKAPGLYQTAGMEFPLAALLRHRGSAVTADTLYRRYTRGANDDPWKLTARSELWLTQPTELPPRKFASCRFTSIRPVLDGVLSDPVWQDADELRLQSENDIDDRDQLEYPFAMLAYDNDYLYFAASIPRVAGMPADLPSRDGRKHDSDLTAFDRLGLFIDTDRDYATYYSLHVDQRGWTSEACWDDQSWNPTWYVAADGDQTHWRIEVAIPMEELTPARPEHRQAWAIGLVRTMPGVGVQSWTQPSGTNPRPESFGLARFD